MFYHFPVRDKQFSSRVSGGIMGKKETKNLFQQSQKTIIGIYFLFAVNK